MYNSTIASSNKDCVLFHPQFYYFRINLKKHRKMKKVQPENNITISVNAYNSFTLNENTKI